MTTGATCLEDQKRRSERVLGHAVGELGHKRAEGREDRAVVVVLGRDLNLAGEQVHHRLVAAVVAVWELLHLAAGGKGDDLVAQADAKDRKLAQAGADSLDHGRDGLGVSGAVGEEDAVGVEGQSLLGGGVPGHDRDLAANGGKALGDAGLLAAVVGHHLVAALPLCRDDVGLLAGDVGHVVVVRDCRGGLDAGHEARGVEVGGGDGRLHGAALADAQGEGARVHVLDGHYAALGEEARQGLHGLPVAGLVAHIVDDEAGKRELARLHVDLVDAVVAHLRVGQGDELAGVGGIAHDLLVAHHRGIEDDLTEGLSLGTCGATEEVAPVLQGEKRLGVPAAIDEQIHSNTVLSMRAPVGPPELRAHKKRSTVATTLRKALSGSDAMDAFSVSRTAFKGLCKYTDMSRNASRNQSDCNITHSTCAYTNGMLA